RIETGGQNRSSGTWLLGAAGGGVPSAGSSDLPPNRLLKRSASDCAEEGTASAQPSPAATTVAIAILTKRSSAMRRPWYPRHLVVILFRRLIAGQWRRTQGTREQLARRRK